MVWSEYRKRAEKQSIPQTKSREKKEQLHYVEFDGKKDPGKDGRGSDDEKLTGAREEEKMKGHRAAGGANQKFCGNVGDQINFRKRKPKSTDGKKRIEKQERWPKIPCRG